MKFFILFFTDFGHRRIVAAIDLARTTNSGGRPVLLAVLHPRTVLRLIETEHIDRFLIAL
jgi:hypothetical protein